MDDTSKIVIAGAVVVLVAGAAYAIYSSIQTASGASLGNNPIPTTPPTSSPAPTPSGPAPTGSTSSNAWVNASSWQGSGYYQWSGSAVMYITSQTQFNNFLNYGTLNPTPGTVGEPWMLPNGGLFTNNGAGYYEIPVGGPNVPATGMTPGTAYNITASQVASFISGVNYWLTSYYSGGGTITVGGSGPATSTLGNNPGPVMATGAGILTLSAQSITTTNGANVVISGSGFTPNSTGTVSANNILLFNYNADNTGKFSNTQTYTKTSSSVSNLANAIDDATTNYIGIVAYSYASSSYSSTAYLYF